MRDRRTFLTTAFGLASSLFAASSTRPLQAAPSNDTLALVVAKDNALRAISMRDLRRLYLGEDLEGPDGKRLIPLNHDRGAPERVAFDEKVLGMDPDEVGRYWIDRKIRGQSGPPKTVSPSARLRAAITHVDGTLTYLRVGDVQEGMKVLSIDGKAPGDPGYALAD
jgi:hypothetical protein